MPNKIHPYNPKLKKLARKLRKNMTLGEVLLWQVIRGRKLGYQFHRQIPILNYIVDFFCHELQLAIEVDGISHDHSQISKEDLERQKELEERGIRFLRFDEMEVRKNMEEVISTIEDWIELNT
ncbi:MAG: endonuclease domain-containing protein [Balneolaceae bacterium]|nr:endonuclease domain-containing protein [Balneolaceae bacterium]MDR9409010.1 endonuclease domain-containing protein [Balneolaceae bacterium]